MIKSPTMFLRRFIPLLAIALSSLVIRPLFADVSSSTVSVSSSAVPAPSYTLTPSTSPIRAIHVTCWQVSSKKYRAYLDRMFKETMVNAVTIDIKEYKGEVYIPVKMAKEVGAFVNAIPDLPAYLAELKKRGIYTIARQVCFKDDIMPRKRPALSVHNQQGEIWYDKHHNTWLDAHNKEAHRYNLLIALQASEMGFDEIQFDYIRFPTDGNLKAIRYPIAHTRQSASDALVEFLAQAHQLLTPRGTRISIDVFGLTTSDNTGMGIGQLIVPMTEQVDYVCPMVYPSHYAKGEYRIPNPNTEAARTVHHALRDAIKTLGPAQAHKLRPYLQDFSLFGVHYGTKEVRAQIQAAADLGIMDWTLWNPRCVYTLTALQTPPEPPRNNAQVSVSTP
jgi:hypothetical protein